MHFLEALPFLVAGATALTCNSAVNSTSASTLSEVCSNAKITGEDWLTVDCDVGSKLGTFGIHLNWCLGNSDSNLAIQTDGNAMESCNATQCSATVTKGKSASMECHADNCRGTVDLDQTITFSGSYLKCGDRIGGSATGLKKRDDNPTTDWSKFCNSDNFNKAQWNAAELGTQLELRSDEFYSDGPCGAGPYPSFGHYKNFMDALKSRTTDLGAYEGCDAQGCQQISALEKACHSSEENPMWLMFMRSIKHYSDWILAVKDGIYQGGNFAKDNATHIIDNFSTQIDTSSEDIGNPLAMMAGLVGAFGGALSAVPGSPGAEISGMLTVASGIANMASTDDNAQLLQNIIMRGDDMTVRINNLTSELLKNVNSWGIGLLSDKVWYENNPYNNTWYSKQSRSLVQVLKDGDFTTGQTKDVTFNVAGNYGKNVIVGALAYTWAKDAVFIVKLAQDVKGTKPCDVDWSGYFRNNAWVCIDDVAYVLHKTKTGQNDGMGYVKLEEPTNALNLKDYGLPNITTLVNAAIKSQESGGYLKNWTMTDVLGSFPDVDTTKVFNLPICEITPMGNAAGGNGKIAAGVGACYEQKDQFGNDFPYKSDWHFYQ